MSLTGLRKRLSRVIDRAARDPSIVVLVRRRVRPAAVILSAEGYEGLIETLAIMGDRRLMASLRKSFGEAKAGKTVPLGEAMRSLGLRKDSR